MSDPSGDVPTSPEKDVMIIRCASHKNTKINHSVVDIYIVTLALLYSKLGHDIWYRGESIPVKFKQLDVYWIENSPS